MNRFLSRHSALLALSATALLTRFWQLGKPPEVVFDEVHFGKFINGYLTGNYFFDIHPPLGKFLLALAGRWGGYDPVFLFTNIGDAYGETVYVALRFAPALFGAAIIPLVYLILKRLGASEPASALGASFVLFDNAILTESRLIVVDSILLACIALALYTYLSMRASAVFTVRWWGWLAASGIAIGCAISVKWTALALVGLVGLDSIAVLATRRSFVSILQEGGARLAGLLLLPTIVYALLFAIHFALLPASGPGDAFMTPAFQSTLVGNNASYEGEPLSFSEKLIELNTTMYTANAGITADHPWKSVWWSWPVMLRGVSYWIRSYADGTIGRVYLLGNPFVWWTSLVGFLTAASYVISIGLDWRRAKEKERHLARMVLFLIGGFLLSWLPFVGVTRVLFLYHYLPSLLFSILATALAFDYAFVSDAAKKRAAITLGMILLVGFLFFAPLSYGTPLTDGAYKSRVWFETWQ